MKEFKYILAHCSKKTRRRLMRTVVFCGVYCSFCLPILAYQSIGLLGDTSWRLQYYHSRRISLLAAAANTRFLVDAIYGVALAFLMVILLISTRGIVKASYDQCAETLRDPPEVVNKKPQPQDVVLTNHGRSLLTVARRLRKASLEYEAFFRADGTKLGEASVRARNHTGVWLDDFERITKNQAAIDIHNHPSGCCAPSAGDFAALCSRGHIGLIVSRHRITTLTFPEDCRALYELEKIEKSYNAAVKQASDSSSAKLAAHHQAYLVAAQSIAEAYNVELKVERFWKWYLRTLKVILKNQLTIMRSALLTNITSCQKAQH